MLLSSCCLASSTTQDGSQHCDYLCIFKHGTLCFLKGLMYSWEAGWFPSPRAPASASSAHHRPLIKLNLFWLHKPLPSLPKKCKYPKLRVASRSAGGARHALQAAGQGRQCMLPACPSARRAALTPASALETHRRINSSCFYKEIAYFSGSGHKGRSVPVRAGVHVHAHRQTRMRARMQAHGKTTWGGEAWLFCFSQCSTKTAEPDHFALRLRKA